MSFLTPQFLFIMGGAALIPIAIHLIWRNKAIRIDFPAMQFLLENNKPMSKWLRWKQLLLLLLRILIVALLAFAFTRPYFNSGGAAAALTNTEKELVIVYDVTASMSPPAKQNAAKKIVNDLLQNANETNIISFIRAGQAPELIVKQMEGTASTKQLISRNLQPTLEAGNLHSAVQEADNILLESSVFSKEIHIISDLQYHAWPVHQPEMQINSTANISLHNIGAETEPTGFVISDVAIGEEVGSNLSVKATSRSVDVPESFEVTLSINDRIVETKRISTEEKQEVLFAFQKPRSLNADAFGKINISGQNSLGSEYFFSVVQPQKIQVLLINGEPESGVADELFYLRKALNLQTSAFDFTETLPMRLNQQDFRRFDVIVFANVRGIDNQSLSRLSDFVSSGTGNIVMFPGDRVSADFSKKYLQTIIFGEETEIGKNSISNAESSGILFEQSAEDLVEKLEGNVTALNSVHFNSHWRFNAFGDATVLARFENGDPALLLNTIGNGSVLLTAFPFDAEWSNFPVHSMFVPLLYAILDFMTPAEESQFAFNVGDPLYVPDHFAANQQISVKLPNGDEVQINPEDQLFSQTHTPGIYQFIQRNQRQYFAVNIDRKECDPAAFELEKFQSFMNTPAAITAGGEVLRASTMSDLEVEQSQKLWRYLLVVVLVLIITESVFANRVPR